MTAALATKPAKITLKGQKQLSKLLTAHKEILATWLMHNREGFVKMQQFSDGEYGLSYCGAHTVGFASIVIYQRETDHSAFKAKKQRIMDFLSGKIDYLTREGEHL